MKGSLREPPCFSSHLQGLDAAKRKCTDLEYDIQQEKADKKTLKEKYEKELKSMATEAKDCEKMMEEDFEQKRAETRRQHNAEMAKQEDQCRKLREVHIQAHKP